MYFRASSSVRTFLSPMNRSQAGSFTSSRMNAASSLASSRSRRRAVSKAITPRLARRVLPPEVRGDVDELAALAQLPRDLQRLQPGRRRHEEHVRLRDHRLALDVQA